MTITTPEILQSKKFLAAALASVLSFFGIRYGLDREQLAFVVGPLVAYIGAQAVADHGKERAKVDALALERRMPGPAGTAGSGARTVPAPPSNPT